MPRERKGYQFPDPDGERPSRSQWEFSENFEGKGTQPGEP